LHLRRGRKPAAPFPIASQLKLDIVRRLSLALVAALSALSTSIAGAATIDERLAPCIAYPSKRGLSRAKHVLSLIEGSPRR